MVARHEAQVDARFLGETLSDEPGHGTADAVPSRSVAGRGDHGGAADGERHVASQARILERLARRKERIHVNACPDALELSGAVELR